jgi:hypothetical protein
MLTEKAALVTTVGEIFAPNVHVPDNAEEFLQDPAEDPVLRKTGIAALADGK